jgi:GH18 family chitinase
LEDHSFALNVIKASLEQKVMVNVDEMENLLKTTSQLLALSLLVEASNAPSGPFALQVAGKQLVSYDDVESVRRKAEYVKEEGLAGASLSTLDLDDFNNLCCQVRGHYIFSALQESIVRLRIRVKMACACKKI